MAKELTAKQKRCEDCANLIMKNGKWCCDECFGQECEEIDDCPEGVELAEIEELAQKAKENKIDHGASSGKKKEGKPRTVKISDEKQMLFSEIWTNLFDVFGENAQIAKENKLILVQIGEKTFKIDLIEQRPKNH